jgi:hypothetical protein
LCYTSEPILESRNDNVPTAFFSRVKFFLTDIFSFFY